MQTFIVLAASLATATLVLWASYLVARLSGQAGNNVQASNSGNSRGRSVIFESRINGIGPIVT